ncbi:hypothetical protein ACF0H5_021308 [Mactra antiquata]
MATTSELKFDAEELKKLLNLAVRPKVKNILTVELRKIESEISLKAETEQKSETEASTSTPKPSQNRIPTVDLKNYAWDQSDKFMKIYVTVPGVESLPKEQVTCNFQERSFSLRCESLNNKNYSCSVSHLMEEIVPAESSYKIKTGMVLVMLKKASAKTWPYVTKTEKQIKDKQSKPPAMDKNADPNDSLMTMMKQMYEDGDDEMKRTIAKAWTESRDKQGQGDFSL